MRTRISLIAVGALWFIWIGIEDQSTLFVLLMAASLVLVLAGVIAERLFHRMPGSKTRRAVWFWLIGLGAGLLVAPIAIVLMTVKISLHHHAVPDFSPAEVINVLHSTPAWVLGALLLSSAAALYDRLRFV
ncbi:MAG: hypothetical protein PVI81_01475 [Anaerolineales bacterium]